MVMVMITAPATASAAGRPATAGTPTATTRTAAGTSAGTSAAGTSAARTPATTTRAFKSDAQHAAMLQRNASGEQPWCKLTERYCFHLARRRDDLSNDVGVVEHFDRDRP